MLSCSIAALAFIVIWPVENTYAAVSGNVAFAPNLNLKKTVVARRPHRFSLTQLARRTRQAAASKCQSRVDNRVVEDSSISPLEASSSRGKFLGSLISSATALVVCTAAAGASGTKAASDGHDAPNSSDWASYSSTGGLAASGREEPQQQLLPAAAAAASESESAASSAISGLVAGAAVSTSKQLLLYPVDTVKTRLQLPRAEGASPELFRGLYDGVLPPLLAGLPSGALFFSAKDACSTAISNISGGQYAELTTVAAVGLAQFPYWGIRTPAELLKIRSQAGMSSGSGGSLEGAKTILADEGVKGLYTGYSSNIAYAFPADAIKFLVYGALKRSAKKSKGGTKLSTIEAAVLGSGASLAAQAVTTPLDVVRTRVMTASSSDEEYEGGVVGALGTIANEEGFSALWAGTTPRVARSVLSGAIQFGSYEFVKGLFGVEPRKL